MKTMRYLENQERNKKEGRKTHKIFCTSLSMYLHFTRVGCLDHTGRGKRWAVCRQWVSSTNTVHCIESSTCFIQKYSIHFCDCVLAYFLITTHACINVSNTVWYKSILLLVWLPYGWDHHIGPSKYTARNKSRNRNNAPSQNCQHK